jgi:hypothetical protein
MSEKPYLFHNATQVSGQMSDTWSPAKGVELHEVRLHSSELMSPTTTLVVQLDSGQGAVYDAQILDVSVSGERSYVAGFAPPKIFRSGDSIVTTTGLAGEKNTYGLENVYKEI